MGGVIIENMAFFFKSRPPYQVGIKKKKMGVPEVGCVGRGSLLQDRLPVKFQDVKFKDPKFNPFTVYFKFYANNNSV